MTNREIIEGALCFLTEKYGFEYRYEALGGNSEYFMFSNGFGSITYHEQFCEPEFSLVFNGGFKVLRLEKEYPERFKAFKKSHSGIKWLFKDKRADFWGMIKEIFSEEIEKNKSLFGLSVAA